MSIRHHYIGVDEYRKIARILKANPNGNFDQIAKQLNRPCSTIRNVARQMKLNRKVAK